MVKSASCDDESMAQIVDMQFNYPVVAGQAEQLAQLLREVTTDGDRLLQFQPYGGRDDHRAAAAAWLSGNAGAIPPQRVMLCSGGHNAVLASLLAAGLRGKKMAADPLTYRGFRQQAEALGIQLVPIEGDGHGMLPASLGEAAKRHGLAGVFLMPTVHNPLGYVMPVERRQQIVEVAQAHGLVIIDDDAYRFCEAAPPPSFSELAPELAFSVTSLTKPVAHAVKVAALAFPAKYADEVATAIRITCSGVSLVLAELAARMMQDGSLDALLTRKRTEAAHRQQLAIEKLQGVVWQAHRTSFHGWIQLPPDKAADHVAAELAAEGVLVSSSQDFVATPDVPANGLRVALGAVADAALLPHALERVRARILGQG
jgi:DNA-binding transcriptional MocR family regulator